MTDKPIIYPLEEIRSYDTLSGWNDTVVGIANISQDAIGVTDTVWCRFAASQNTSPDLHIKLGDGTVYELAPLDAIAYSELGPNATMVTQQGFAAAQTLALNTSGLSAGQSKWALVQCKFSQVDDIPATDPNNGILPYINPADPTNPFYGPNNSNVPQNTARLGVATVSVKYGTPATSGSAVPPTPDANYVAMYLVELTFGQTVITTGEILLAGDSAYSGYQEAPLFPGVIGQIPGQSGSHHGGISGQAAKINLTNGAEIQGIAPFPNLPVSNPSPPTVTGIVTVAGDIPILSQGAGVPQGALAGNQNDQYLDLDSGLLWICTTSGSSGSAVWTPTGSAGISNYQTTSFTALPGFCYVCDTSGGDITVTLSAVALYGKVPIAFKNVGSNAVILTPNGSTSIEFQANGAVYRLNNKTDFVRLTPTASPSPLFLIT